MRTFLSSSNSAAAANLNPVRSPSTRRLARLGLVGGVVAGLSLVALPVGAHVEATPAVVRPGVSTTITFTGPHGCLASPTVKVAVKFPASIAKVVTVAPNGWTGSVSGSVATFTGGPLPVNQKAGFGLTFIAPKTEGTVQFPTVQTCEKGQNAWVQQTLANGDEPDYPVPTVLVSSKPTNATKTSKTSKTGILKH